MRRPTLPADERTRRILFGFGIFLALLALISLAVALDATLFAADATRLDEGYAVGEFQEPPPAILQSIDGKEQLTLQHLFDPEAPPLSVPVRELKLVAPRALTTRLGACAGSQARRQGNARTRNRVFLRQWRVACAAFTAFCFRRCGRPGLSFGAAAQYAQLRRRGARLVASKVSTRYAPYYPYYKPGDLLAFHKRGGRIGHVELCIGGGWTVGTSSSAGYVARRRVGNRGFRLMSVLRP